MFRFAFAFAVALAFSASPALAAKKRTPPPEAAAETRAEKGQYGQCIRLAKSKPEQGWEEALAWQSLGGGEEARHCAAVALIGMGKFGEAASRLEALAAESIQVDAVRAEMMAQAAQAWVSEGLLPQADVALKTALRLAPRNAEIMIDHAVVLAQLKKNEQAVELLSAVLRSQPNRVEVLTLRASALRVLSDLKGARADLEKALKTDPNFVDARLERGVLLRLEGQEAKAREDLLKVIRLVPESQAADIARRNLEEMDVRLSP